MIFNCSWDTTVSLITCGYLFILLIVIVGLAIPLVCHIKAKQILSVTLLVLGILLVVGVLLVPAIATPCRVSVENKTLTIHRVQKNIVISIENIEEIRLCNDTDTHKSKRTFGSGGAFGYLGKFSNKQLGDYLMYVTDRSQRILLKSDDKFLIFSCDHPEQLVDLIKQQIP